MTNNYYPLTEARVVRELIRGRIYTDTSYVMKLYESNDPSVSNGVPPFDEDILCVYIDLDRAIAKCGLSPMQLEIVNEMMKGYSISDIADVYYDQQITKQGVLIQFHRAVDKICKYADAVNTEWANKRLKDGAIDV